MGEHKAYSTDRATVNNISPTFYFLFSWLNCTHSSTVSMTGTATVTSPRIFKNKGSGLSRVSREFFLLHGSSNTAYGSSWRRSFSGGHGKLSGVTWNGNCMDDENVLISKALTLFFWKRQYRQCKVLCWCHPAASGMLSATQPFIQIILDRRINSSGVLLKSITAH